MAIIPEIVRSILRTLQGLPDTPLLEPTPTGTSIEYDAEVGRGASAPSKALKGVENFGAEMDRRERVVMSRSMYREDPRPNRLIKEFAKHATAGQLVVEVHDADFGELERAQQIADDLLKRVDINERLTSLLRKAFRDGDLFLDVDVATNLAEPAILDFFAVEPLRTIRVTNQKDQFVSKEKAFLYSETNSGPMYSTRDGDKDGKVWYPLFFMVHARWDHEEGEKYGSPMFASAGRSYRFLREGELDVGVRRKTRAGIKYVHTLVGAGEGEINEYRRLNQDVLSNPLSAVSDYFTNAEGSIKALDGDGGTLDKLGDIEHHQEVFSISAPLPLKALAFNGDLNRDILEDMMLSYQISVEDASMWAIDAIVRPLLEREWILHRVLPRSLTYTIRRENIKPLTAPDLDAVAGAINKMKATAIYPDEMLLRIASTLIPQIDAQEAIDALIARANEQPDEISRIAGLAGVELPTEARRRQKGKKYKMPF